MGIDPLEFLVDNLPWKPIWNPICSLRYKNCVKLWFFFRHDWIAVIEPLTY